MRPMDLHQERDVARLLKRDADLERLLRIMVCWWDGATLATIASQNGISVQRVGKLLARVGCTKTLWQRADHDRPDSRREASPTHLVEARCALMHRLAGRLTVRQRAALAWQALGLRQTDVAKRTVTSPQNVRNLVVAARWRLERLSSPKRPKQVGLREQRAAPVVAPPVDDVDLDIDWGELINGISEQSSQVAGHAGHVHDVGAGRDSGVTGRRRGASGGRVRPRHWNAHVQTQSEPRARIAED